MGMDVIGKKPKSEIGECFHNNCWRWRPLWNYTCDSCELADDIRHGGHYNDGIGVGAHEADRIGKTLLSLIESGQAAQYKEERDAVLCCLPNKTCKYCNGTGFRHDARVDGVCNACHGSGVLPQDECLYNFDVENVKGFAEFCVASGGFEIW